MPSAIKVRSGHKWLGTATAWTAASRAAPAIVRTLSFPRRRSRFRGRVKFYDRPADSGNIVSRGFCPNCGSAVYSTNSGMPGVVFPRASSLDDPEIAKPQMIVFASRAPSWDHVDPELPAFPTMPDGGPRQVIADSN